MTDLPTSLAGKMLIAMPDLADPNFWQSVVLLGVHSEEEGAFGLIINRMLDIDMMEILGQLGGEEATSNLPSVLAGGPVQPNHGFVLYERGIDGLDDGEIAISASIGLSGSTDTLLRLAATTGRRFYLLLGYSGWHPGQLEREIEENSWLVAPLDTSIIFDVPVERRWAAALDSIGVDPGTLVDTGSTEPS